MSEALIRCGEMLTIRSSKALERRNIAQSSGITVDEAIYAIGGIKIEEVHLNNKPYTLKEDDPENKLSTGRDCPAMFFDQTHYTFSIQLPKETKEAYIFSISPAWCESADWDSSIGRLTVPINFGNNLGDFELCWEWVSEDGVRHVASFSSQVYSSKLDIYKHFKIMFNEVEDRFNWLKLDLLRQTAWGWQFSQESAPSKNTWLLIFQKVRSEMEQLLIKMSDRHRRRLIDKTVYMSADRLKRISPKLEEKIYEGIKINPVKRFADKRKILVSDTPENRYIKHILIQTLAKLNEVSDNLENNENFSDIFKRRLKEWSDQWTALSRNRFWKGIGPYKGLRRESLILSQDPVYAGIRRNWFLLQQGLEFLDADLKGGIQDASQLYEIWCLAKIIEIVEESGWKNRTKVDGNPLYMQDNSDLIEKCIGSVRFDFNHNSNAYAVLSVLFQPTAGKSPDKGIWKGMTAEPVVQNPDIVLRLKRNDLPGKPVYTWIFDAKYRINNNLAPDDAINQMHRYRDAILWQGDSANLSKPVRESIGAYILYPGDESRMKLEGKEKPKQIASIDKTNIGAFPLKPSENGKRPNQLTEKLNKLLSLSEDYKTVNERIEEYFKSVPTVKYNRKNLYAKCITRYHDDMNTKKYWENCRLYRLPDRVVKLQNLRPDKWSYLIPTSPEGEQLGNFPILSIEKLERSDIKKIYDDLNLPMYIKDDAAHDKYWLFLLGEEFSNMPTLDNLKTDEIVIVSGISEEPVNKSV